MNNIAIKIREVNSEVLVFLDKNCPNELVAMREAIKLLQKEVMRNESPPIKHISG